jgi:hypothetical protein
VAALHQSEQGRVQADVDGQLAWLYQSTVGRVYRSRRRYPTHDLHYLSYCDQSSGLSDVNAVRTVLGGTRGPNGMVATIQGGDTRWRRRQRSCNPEPVDRPPVRGRRVPSSWTKTRETPAAAWGERSPERINSRNGYRSRDFDTRAGTIALDFTKLRGGTYFPP